MAAALAAALEDVGPLVGEQRVFAALAARAAGLVDAGWRANDTSAVVRGTTQLRELVDLLPLRAAREGVGDDGDGDPGARVLQLLDSPPGMGDAT